MIVSVPELQVDAAGAAIAGIALSSKFDTKRNMVVVLAFDRSKTSSSSSTTAVDPLRNFACALGQKYGSEFRQLYACFLDDFDQSGETSNSDEKMRPERWALTQLTTLVQQSQPPTITHASASTRVLHQARKHSSTPPKLGVWRRNKFVPYELLQLGGPRSRVLALGGLFDYTTGSLLKPARLLPKDGGDTSSVGGAIEGEQVRLGGFKQTRGNQPAENTYSP